MDQQIAGLAALYLVIELLKFLLPLIMKRHSVLTEAERTRLKELHDWHSAKDPSTGTPLWYREGSNVKIDRLRDELLKAHTEVMEEERDTHTAILAAISGLERKI